MNNLEPRQITIQPIISYPREAEVGKTYLLTLDIQAVAAEDYWPYQSEELELYCSVDSEPVFSTKPLGEPVIILNRFGGSYGPASFTLTASSKGTEGKLRINLVNGQGLLVHQVELTGIRIHESPPIIKAHKSEPISQQNIAEKFENYFLWLYRSVSNLSMAAIDPKAVYDASSQQIALNSVYVLPHVLGSDEKRTTSVIDTINKHSRLVILGEPGSGKTAFLNYLVLCISGEALQNKDINLSSLTQRSSDTQQWNPLTFDGRANLSSPTQQPSNTEGIKNAWDHGLLLLVKITLRDFATRGLPNSSDQLKADDIWSFLKTEPGIEDFVPNIQNEFIENGGLLLLDGLDEIPAVDQKRWQIKQFIEEVANAFPKVRIIVSSRTYAYQSQPQRLSRFSEVILAPFSREQINIFIERWYGHLAVLGNLQLVDAQSRAESLKQALNASEHLRSLAERPLLLTLLVSLHAWRGGSLPEKREELYADAVDLMLDFWERQKVERDSSGKVLSIQPGLAEWLKVGRDKVRSLLNRLAYEAHATQPDISGPAHINESDIVTSLLTLSDSPDLRPGQLVGYLSTRTGILLPQGAGIYSLPHRTLQEYLAACHLTNENYPEQVADLVRSDPNRWREVALLAGARAARGSTHALWALVDALCYANHNSVKKPSLADVWGAHVAGELIAESTDLSNLNERNTASLNRVRQWLVYILRSEHMPTVERAGAGNILARLGDPRSEVLSVDQMLFCYVPPGLFWMGDNKGRDNEKPQHQLDIPYGYWLAKFPVTNAQFEAFIHSDGYANEKYWQEAKTLGLWHDGQIRDSINEELRYRPFQWGHPFNLPNHPVVGISWLEALAFTRWLTEKWKGQGKLPHDWVVQLPSEAEWEKAARGGIRVPISPFISPKSPVRELSIDLVNNPNPQTDYTWGREADPDRANYLASSIGSSNAVGCFPGGVSAYGCEEMLGNVREWTRSLERSYPYDPFDGREEVPASNDQLIILRGGSYKNSDYELRSSYRGRNISPNVSYRGFRLAIIPDPRNKRDSPIENYSWVFVRNISPTDAQFAEVYGIVNELKDKLSNIRTIQDAYLEIIMYGSVARGTAIAPIADIDILLLLKLNPLKESPKIACTIVQELLLRLYSKNQTVDSGKARQVRSFGASTIVQLPDRLRLEVTPAVVSVQEQNEILIPDWRVQRWVPSNHNRHADVARGFDQQTNGQFTALVKMFKYWYLYAHEIRFLHSFVAECLVAANFEPSDNDLLSAFEQLLKQLQTRYKSAEQLTRVPVMGVKGETKTTAIKARQHQKLMAVIDVTLQQIKSAQEIQSWETKVQMWRKIFGDKFPEKLLEK